jgi:uncharacterized protein
MQPTNRSQILLLLGVTAVVLMVIAQVWLRLSPVVMIRLLWKPEHFLFGVGLAIAVTLASSVIYQVWSPYRESADYYLDLILKPLILPDLIWVGLLPGLSEELLFRGVMLPEFGLDWGGIVLSSLCFGALHMTNFQHWAYVVWATLIGIVFAWSAVVTGNLLVPIVAHILTNLISAIVWKSRQVKM